MSTLRITGLASGIDYESMITKLMDAQRVPLDKLNQKKQVNQWVQDDYRTINNKILDFKNAAFDMKLQSAYMTKTATSSDETVAKVTGGANAVEGQYSLQVKQLASTATLSSGKLTGTTPQAMGFTSNSISINGVDITIDPSAGFDDFANKINAQSVTTGVKVAYDSTLKTMFFSSTKTGTNAKIDLRGSDVGKLFKAADVKTSEAVTGNKPLTSDMKVSTLTSEPSFNLNVDGTDHTFSITSSMTVGDLITNINKDLQGSGITVSLDPSGNFSFNNADKSKAISFTGNTGTVASDLGLSGAVHTDTAPTVFAAGKNAKVLFNGVDGEYDSNSFTIAGLSITAKQEGSAVSKISITQDVDTVFNKIKSFIDKYNDLIGSINSELSEERYRDYTPLTDAQKKDMSDTQIEQWESKAKSGLLANDSLLSSSLYSMRQSLSSSVGGLATGQMKFLSDIGISSALISGSTVSGSYLDNGKLYIDETKLKQMISEKPDEVMALFTADDKNANSSAGDGIATRLYTQASKVFSQIIDKAGASTSVKNTYILGKASLDLDDQISRLQTRLDDMEDRYYAQFTQMETYISQMNSRSSSLASMFNTGG